MVKYNFKGRYIFKENGKERLAKKENIVFKKWKDSKEELEAELEPNDYYNLKRRYENLRIVTK